MSGSQIDKAPNRMTVKRRRDHPQKHGRERRAPWEYQQCALQQEHHEHEDLVYTFFGNKKAIRGRGNLNPTKVTKQAIISDDHVNIQKKSSTMR